MSRQRVLWIIISLAIFLVFSLVGLAVSQQEGSSDLATAVSLEMPVKNVAKTLGVTPDYLASEMGVSGGIDKEKKVSAYNVTQEKFDEAVKHILSHKPAVFKQFIMLGLCVFGAFFLLIWGRSEDGKTLHYNRLPYYVVLVLTIIASFWLGKSPSPMEGIVKLFKAYAGLYPDILEKTVAPTLMIVLFVVLVNKLICGWACPFGALQELANSIPWIGGLKKIKIPFWISNTVRGILFVVFILVLFGVVGDLKGVTIFHYINPFNMFDLNFAAIGVVICVLVSLIGGIFIYRPFCHFVCPMGFVSWIFEQVSIFKVRINKDVCIKCGKCAAACPSDACQAIIDEKAIKPDCYSCARCLSKCPVDAIKYGLKYKNK